MKLRRYIIAILIGSNFLVLSSQLPINPPKFLDLEVNWASITKSQAVFQFNNPDTFLTHQMRLLTDENDFPLLYYADIITPVCIDGLCKPVYIELYWDLLGKYAGYGVYSEQLLTKFDHEIFTAKDYQRLHELLLNPHSILERRKVSDLYDIGQPRAEKIKFNGEEIDGITGATKKEIKTSIVEGALYSCHTLWHLTYGDAAKKIKAQLPLIYNDSLARFFLESNHEVYQFYALKKLVKTDFESKINQLIPILIKGNPLIRAYLLKKMPKSLLAHPLIVTKIFRNFSFLDFNSRTLLINRLQYSNSVAAIALAEQLSIMSKKQLQIFLNQLEVHEQLQSEILLKHLRKHAVNKHFVYSYLIKDFLEHK